MSFRATAYALQQPQDAQQKLLVKWWGVAVYNTLLWDVAKVGLLSRGRSGRDGH